MMTESADMLKRALGHHKAGRLQEAEKAYAELAENVGSAAAHVAALRAEAPKISISDD